MSKTKNILSDHQSEINTISKKGRPAVPLSQILHAADKLFNELKEPKTVSMDAIAKAAGVGKGTLFRAFGSRDKLLDALWAEKSIHIRNAIDGKMAPLGSDAPTKQRIHNILSEVLAFKLKHRYLIRAWESSTSIYQSDSYWWLHKLLFNLTISIAKTTDSQEIDYIIYLLLSGLQINLIDQLSQSGLSDQAIIELQSNHIQKVLNTIDR